MRSINNTSLSFGLVNVPVKMYTATADHDLKFKMYLPDGSPVGQQWINKDTGEVIDYGDAVKGIEVDGDVVIVTKADFAGVEEDAGKALEVIQFAPAAQVDPLMLEKAYYLAPADARNVEGYALLREVMGSTDRVGIVRYTYHGKTHLAVLRVAGKVLTLQNLAWSDEVREPAFPALDKPISLDPKMVELAQALVESLSGDFHPVDHTDTYTERLGELIAARNVGKELPAVQITPEDEVGDLLAALEKSIAKHPAGKGKGKKQEVA